MPGTNRFARVASSGGQVVDTFSQQAIPGSRASICVPLSLMWTVTEMTRLATVPVVPARPLNRLVTAYSDLVKRYLAVMQARVDGPLDFFAERVAALNHVTAYNASAGTRDRPLPPYVVRAVEVLCRTRSGARPQWPEGLEALLTRKLNDAATPFLHQPPAPPWKQVVTYPFVDDAVPLFTKSLYTFGAYNAFDGPPPPIDHVDGYRLLVMRRLTEAAGGEFASLYGHMVAIRDEGMARTLYDPNAGVVRFDDPGQFTSWFRGYFQENYQQPFGGGGFVKTFLPWKQS